MLPALGITTQLCRHQSDLPTPVKVKTIDKTLELRTADVEDSNQRPLVVLFGWMLAKKRHLNKYGNLYLSKGFDVLSIQVPPQQILWPTKAQQRITSLLHTLNVSLVKFSHCNII